jgi:hypothetical protein
LTLSLFSTSTPRLHEVEQRLATNAWHGNDAGERGDWNDVARSLLAGELEEAEQALAYNYLSATLSQ